MNKQKVTKYITAAINTSDICLYDLREHTNDSMQVIATEIERLVNILLSEGVATPIQICWRNIYRPDGHFEENLGVFRATAQLPGAIDEPDSQPTSRGTEKDSGMTGTGASLPSMSGPTMPVPIAPASPKPKAREKKEKTPRPEAAPDPMKKTQWVDRRPPKLVSPMGEIPLLAG